MPSRTIAAAEAARLFGADTDEDGKWPVPVGHVPTFSLITLFLTERRQNRVSISRDNVTQPHVYSLTL